MSPLNTRDRKVKHNGIELRDAFTKYSTERQRVLIKKLMTQHDVTDETIWAEHFDGEYPAKDPNWKETISSGAAGEIIQYLLNIQSMRVFNVKSHV